jgi:1-acyl-sn-glycerol-3-phosphate acyltransferase
VWQWLVIGATIALWLPLMALVRLVTLPFDRDAYWTGYLFRKIGNVSFALSPLWSAKVSGTMPANPRNPYVVVSNHESFVDILLISHLPWEMKWLSKVELFNIPVLGWLLRLARISRQARQGIERGGGDAALPGQAAAPHERDDLPEGTRSRPTVCRSRMAPSAGDRVAADPAMW